MPPITVERWHRNLPEPKLELIDGKLIVGNSLAGSRALLRELLYGWGLDAGVCLAPTALWRQALRDAADRPDPPPPPPAGPMRHAMHHAVANQFRMALFDLTRAGHYGVSLGRDCAMRLGDNVFTPDTHLVGWPHVERVTDSYTDGPADLVIEVLWPGHEAQDREVKRRFYEAGGVAEYWVVDPVTEAIEYLRLTPDGYSPHQPDADGRYRPASVPGLAFVPAQLWKSLRDDRPLWAMHDYHGLFEAEAPDEPRGRYRFPEGEWHWECLPFAPAIGLTPQPLTVAQFMAWCPEAKFELIHGKPSVGNSLGTRNTLGMLLQTFGLSDVLSLFPARDWRAAVEAVERDEQAAEERKAEWWAFARETAALLRERHHLGRIAVIGDLVRPRPLNCWSSITFVLWDVTSEQTWAISQTLYHRDRDQRCDFIRAEQARRPEREQIEHEAVDL
jgi:hypothetical protein